MERTNCPVCGSDEADILFVGKDEWHGRQGEFPTLKCHICGHIYLSPRPTLDEIGAYYPDTYQPYTIAPDDEPSAWQRFNRRLALRKRVKYIRKHVPVKGKVLDVGCATGNFLAALRDDGWQVQGVEVSEYAVNYGRTRHQLDIFHGLLDEASFPDNSFDLVSFWDVLEHVHDPVATLQEANRLTKTGGYLLLLLPNPSSLEAKLFGGYWAGWDTPRHLNVPSEQVLETRLLPKTGWQFQSMHCLTGRIWLFNLSLAHWLNNHIDNDTQKRWIMRVMRSLPMRLLSLPIFGIIERLRLGSVMAILARKL